MSKINLQRGKLTVENRKSREKKRICSEVSVNSPGNPSRTDYIVLEHYTAVYRRHTVRDVTIMQRAYIARSAVHRKHISQSRVGI